MRALVVPLVICGQVGSAHAHGKSTDSVEEGLTVGGIAIGQSEASVIAALGKPKQRKEEADFFLPVKLFYPGLIVSLDEQGVGGVLTTSKTFCTPASICPGMTYAQVKNAYGPSDAYEREGDIFRDYLWNDGCWLRVEFKNDLAERVETICSP